MVAIKSYKHVMPLASIVVTTLAESYYFKQHVVSFDPAGVVWMKVAIKSCKHMMP